MLVASISLTKAASCFPTPVHISQISTLQHPGPIAAIGCPAPPALPCVQSGQPTVSPVVMLSGPPSVYAVGEARVVAPTPFGGAINNGFEATRYLVESSTSLTGSWSTVYDFDSLESAYESQPNSSAVYDLTGLPADRYVRVRAAFCNISGSLKGCTCWSEAGFFDTNADGTADRTPSAFPIIGPAPPALMAKTFEDNFRRLPTNAKGNDGDGLGPLAVWVDNLSSTTNQPVIATATDCPVSGSSTLSDCASLPAGPVVHSTTQPAANIYADLKLRPKAGGTSFNFALTSRYHLGSGTSDPKKFFQVKFVNGWLRITKPTLLIMTADEFDRFEQQAPNMSEGPTCPEITATIGVPVAERDFACLQDPNMQPGGEFFWLRNWTRTVANEPVVTAAVAWGCSDGNDLSSCAHYFSKDRTFEGDHPGMNTVRGPWHLTDHDIPHLVDIARFGVGP